MIDVHSPLELLLPRGDVPPAIVESLSRAGDLPIVDDVGGPCPGAFDDWLLEVGVPAIVYEVEQAGLAALCARNLPGLLEITILQRRAARPLCASPARPGGASAFPERPRQAILTGPGRRRRGGRTYSTRVTAARLCVVSSPV